MHYKLLTGLLVLTTLLATLGSAAPLGAQAPMAPAVSRPTESLPRLPLVPTPVQITDLQAGSVFTWTQDTRADWEQGTLFNLDSTTVSGTLRLEMQHYYFSANETLTPRAGLASGKSSPDIATDVAGNAYAMWEDYRNGVDIYFAYRSAGGVWDANVKVNNDVGTADQNAPALAVDGSGNAYAVWQDYRNGNWDIYFAFRPAGGTWGTNIKINDDAGTAGQYSPAIAVDSNGNVYVMWEDSRNGNTDIYFAYRTAGGAWGANIKVNDDTGTASQCAPAIAVDVTSNAYAVWQDSRNGNADIYFAYRPAGGAWSTNVKINDDAGTAVQGNPALVVDGSSNVYAVWEDFRDGTNIDVSYSDIYFATRPAGGVWGANVKVNDTTSAWWMGAPALAVDGSGNIYAAWQHGPDDIYFATHPAGGAWGTNVKINDDAGMAVQRSPALAVDGSGNAYAVWEDSRNGNFDIYFAYRTAGGVWGANIKVNDDTTGAASQYAPAIAADAAGNTYAVWVDDRNGDSDIYFTYRPAGGVWGANVKINDDAGTAAQSLPDLAVDGSGNIYVVWEDYRNGNADIYFAYRPAGGAWGANVKINDDETAWHKQETPALAVDTAGNAYVVWRDFYVIDEPFGDTFYYYDIHFAIRPAGGAWGANVKVNTDIGITPKYDPALAVDSNGNAYAVWQVSQLSGDYICFAYRPADGAWGSDVIIDDLANGADPALAVDSSGNAYAMWRDMRNEPPLFGDIYFAYRPAGGTWGANVKVNDDAGMTPQGYPALAVDGSGNAYAVWQDSRNGNDDVYFAYRPAGGTWGVNIKVNDDAGTASQGSPALSVDGSGNAYVIWYDQRAYDSNLYFSFSLPKSYLPTGIYTASALDTAVNAAIWHTLTYSTTIPAGTALTVATRSRVAGRPWSAWQETSRVSETFGILSPLGQYLQYRVTFTTSFTDATPVLDWVRVNYVSVGTPSAPRFVTPCGVTNQSRPMLKGAAAAGSIIQLYVDGAATLTTTTGADGAFTLWPSLSAGSHTITATASNAQGVGPVSALLTLTMNPALPYDPISVRTEQLGNGTWLRSPPRDAQGCANPAGWRVWPRAEQAFYVQVPVSYTTQAAVTATVGTQTITLTEGSGKLFAGVFSPPLHAGTFILTVTTEAGTVVVPGGPVLIDPDGVVYELTGAVSTTIAGAQVTCYYSDTHSGQWLVWDAWNYGQVNPQTTLADGYYSFYTPPGTYRVVAEKTGYPTYTSPDLVVVATPVRHNIPLRVIQWHIYLPLTLRNR